MKTFLLVFVLLLPAASALADATAVKLSDLGRSITFRDGAGHRGDYGFNGGSWSRHVFDGDFDNYAIQNGQGAEIVIPTTGLDENQQDTGIAWYVTEIKVGHRGDTKYSLYYTTEPEPANILSNAKDPRAWLPIEDATGIQAAGTKSYPVSTVATAVKYVFDTVNSWSGSLGEVEVWGVNPADQGCLHPSYTDWEEVPGSATCTTFGKKRRKCTACGETFVLDEAPPLGHVWENHLARAGTSSTYGNGTLVCSRCGESIIFNVPLDLATQGGVAIPGKVQFADLSVSSTAPGSGAGPDQLIDGAWTWEWGDYWMASSLSESEFIQYDFATEIDLTKIEWSAPNHALTLKFYLWDGETEEPLAEVPIAQDDSGLGYRRGSLLLRGISAKGIRLHIEDRTGELYGNTRCIAFSELHPHGTVKGAGLLDVVRTRILLY